MPRWTRLGGLPWRRWCRGLLLPLLLLLMQQGALLHELSHQAAPEIPQETSKQHAHGAPCAVCLAFAQAGTAAAPSLVAPGLLAGLSFQAPLPSRVDVGTNTLPTPRSRGPPITL